MHLIAEILLFLPHMTFILCKSLFRWIVPKKHKSIKGEICLITGAGSGIGRLMAIEFAKLGAIVILWDVNENGNNETLELITKEGGTAFADKCDVSNREEVYKAAERARTVASGEITILVNNAGIVFGKDFLDIKDEEIEKTIQVNTLSHFWTTRAFLPNMLQNNHGHIVSTASALGLFASPGMPDYVASKHAVVGFHNALELDLRKYEKDGIKTTLVCPYHINTGMFRGVGSRFPNLLPSLKPDECVKEIMNAVLTDQTMLAVPKTMYLCYNVVTWIPHEGMLLIHKLMGTFQAMNKFVPNRKYQKDAVENKDD